MPLESQFKSDLIDELHDLFPNCIVFKTDVQGFPDVFILFHNKWACLETKRSSHERYQPNQEYWLEVLDEMSFASMICPENKEAVLHGLQQSLAPRRATRVSKCIKVPLGELY